MSDSVDRRWTLIAERMPEVGAPVWLTGPEPSPYVTRGYADGERWRTEGEDDRYHRCRWTHWMPRERVPDPPWTVDDEEDARPPRPVHRE